MDTLIAALLVCLDLTKIEAANGPILRSHMIERCEVVRSSAGKRQGKAWMNATLDCKCKR